MASYKNQPIPDSMLKHLEYLRSLHLESPRLGNVFLEDSALREYSSHVIEHNEKFVEELVRLGDRFSTCYLEAARNAEENPPRLEQFDSYGKRIDKLHLSDGWNRQKKFAAEDGIVSLAYESDQYGLGKFQRFGQLIVLYMYHPSSGLFGCPLAMTDGAAYTIKSIREDKGISARAKRALEQAYNGLISRKDAWTSGQWMTQKKGGSDVSNTETVAIQDPKSSTYHLYGYKWFTSATDSNMSLALAKILHTSVEPTAENLRNVKVSLFYVKMREEDGSLNNMEIVRLKDKLGTRQLPTAQLLLKGAKAELISEPEKGVKMISKMLTITRIYNSSTAVGIMRRGLALSRDYASRRTIGRSKLSTMPLQLRVLANLQAVHRGNLILYLRLSELFSKQHHEVIDSHESNILRVMIPLMKLFTGKEALSFLSEILESFGGMGYIQGSMLPVMLRDAQVLTIWEGTTNVLCYDFVRALLKKENEFEPIQSIVRYFLKNFQEIKNKDLSDERFCRLMETLIFEYNKLFKDINQAVKTGFKESMSELRTYCFGLTRLYIAMELAKHYITTYRSKDLETLERWIGRKLYQPEGYCPKMDRKLGLDVDDFNNERGTGDLDSRMKTRSRL